MSDSARDLFGLPAHDLRTLRSIASGFLHFERHARESGLTGELPLLGTSAGGAINFLLGLEWLTRSPNPWDNPPDEGARFLSPRDGEWVGAVAHLRKAIPVILRELKLPPGTTDHTSFVLRCRGEVVCDHTRTPGGPPEELEWGDSPVLSPSAVKTIAHLRERFEAVMAATPTLPADHSGGRPAVTETIPTDDTSSTPRGDLSAWMLRCGGRLKCSPDCASVVRVRDGKEFTFTGNQRRAVAFMVAVFDKGRKRFTNKELFEQSTSVASDKSFRNVLRSNGEQHEAWGDLIIELEDERGVYTLNLDPQPENGLQPG